MTYFVIWTLQNEKIYLPLHKFFKNVQNPDFVPNSYLIISKLYE